MLRDVLAAPVRPTSPCEACITARYTEHSHLLGPMSKSDDEPNLQ
jgi:hypothetical protein